MINKNIKTGIYVFLIILIIGFSIVYGIKSWMKSMMDSKPNGPYHSSVSIEESKKTNVLLSIYIPTKTKYYSENNLQSYKINEVWIEKSKIDTKEHWEESRYKYILNIYFKYMTDDDLHKFRFIRNEPKGLDMFEQIEHPDGSPRIRFLLNNINDTLKLEVIERNPTDSLAWITEKVIDTIILIKKPRY